MEFNNFSFLFSKLHAAEKKNLVVVNGNDDHTLEAVALALKMGLVSVTITGDSKKINSFLNKLNVKTEYKVIKCSNELEALDISLELCRNGKADLIMKGLISTDQFMKGLLNKEKGLLAQGALLSHLAIVKNESYKKPLIVSDVAILPLPNLEQKKQITHYLIKVANQIGVDKPKVAFIAATEKIIAKMPACTDAYKLKLAWENGEFGNSICDGPMALDLAVDLEASKIKGYESEVAGDADCLLFPNIESGNVFYKMNTKFCKAQTAAIVMGTMVPTVLSSRGDSTETKLNSIALAALVG